MAENKEYITQQESAGAIQISEDVVASIATAAALETEGVSAMMGPGSGVMIRYGFAMAEVAGKVQKAVLAALHDMTGFSVRAVNVMIGGICFD